MLELSLPPPMPHAVGLDQPFNSLTLQSTRSKHMQPYPPQIPRANADAYLSRQSCLPTPHHLPVDRRLAASSAMTSSHGGFGPSKPVGRSENYGGQAPYSTTAPPPPYSNSLPPPYQVNGHSADFAGAQQPTPANQRSLAPPPYSSHRRKTSSNSVAPSLQIPRTIRAPQNSIPQLAAEVTCLFWFENSTLLQQIEDTTFNSMPSGPLSTDALPTSGFRKWVATILSTTQVAQNVILLALLFIYRLKNTNPGVKGKPGSEYRLLTVALMLGNKFLDDNTYTNKTWAEVSGISVQEVHIMEVEFLSNMRYSLFTSEAQWKEWQTALGKFGTFIDRASRPDFRARSTGPPISTMQNALSLPSPPISTNASPPFVASYSPNQPTYTNTPLILPQVSSAAISPIGPLPELDLGFGGRKRSLDASAAEPPAKRAARSFPQQSASQPAPSTAGQMMSRVHAPPLPRLPMPNLPSLSIPSSGNGPPPASLPNKLPLPAGRAMSMIFPPPHHWSQTSSMPASAAQAPAMPQAHTFSTNTPTRQLSPYPGVPSAGSSPVSASFPSSHVLPQPQSRLSPSYFLAQRNSPYRPVRSVTTLLVPPPSGSVHAAPRSVGYEQMQYQPLGRPIQERKVGPLPYMSRDAWTESHQPHPLQQQHQPQPQSWSELPPLQQPNFRR